MPITHAYFSEEVFWAMLSVCVRKDQSFMDSRLFLSLWGDVLSLQPIIFSIPICHMRGKWWVPSPSWDVFLLLSCQRLLRFLLCRHMFQYHLRFASCFSVSDTIWGFDTSDYVGNGAVTEIFLCVEMMINLLSWKWLNSVNRHIRGIFTPDVLGVTILMILGSGTQCAGQEV